MVPLLSEGKCFSRILSIIVVFPFLFSFNTKSGVSGAINVGMVVERVEPGVGTGNKREKARRGGGRGGEGFFYESLTKEGEYFQLQQQLERGFPLFLSTRRGKFTNMCEKSGVFISVRNLRWLNHIFFVSLGCSIC